jgi:hypothetical protein
MTKLTCECGYTYELLSIVGIEVLDASEHFGFKKERPEIELENIKVA